MKRISGLGILGLYLIFRTTLWPLSKHPRLAIIQSLLLYYYILSINMLIVVWFPLALLHTPPTLEQFTEILLAKSGHCPSGLHVQNCSSDMLEEDYHCLATMQFQRQVPHAWKSKRLVPIPKMSKKKFRIWYLSCSRRYCVICGQIS